MKEPISPIAIHTAAYSRTFKPWRESRKSETPRHDPPEALGRAHGNVRSVYVEEARDDGNARADENPGHDIQNAALPFSPPLRFCRPSAGS